MQKEKTDLRERTKTFALRVVRMFSALPKTTEAQVLGKQLLRSGTSIGANYREAFRARSKDEFIAKCGDSLREIEEWSGYPRHRWSNPARQRASCWGGSESKRLLAGTARGIGGCRRRKARIFATEVRRADRDFRYHPETSEDLLILN